MRPSFLFDTSAFIALSADHLEVASQSADLRASPFCFWELLTHLEEAGRFQRLKGNLKKFRYVTILDDPDAEVHRTFLPSSHSVHSRVRDGDLADAALAALDRATSVAEFYGGVIRDEAGAFRLISDCISRVRAELDNKENKFQAFLEKIVAVRRSGSLPLVTDSDYDRAVDDLARGWWLHLQGGKGENSANFQQFVGKTYLYYSYVIRRACEYAENRNPNRKIDKNDFEDARLCLHLGLTNFTAVVALDGPLHRCLSASLTAMNAKADATRHMKLAVWDPAVFPGDSKTG